MTKNQRKIRNMEDTMRERANAVKKNINQPKNQREQGAAAVNEAFSTENVFAVITKQGVPDLMEKFSASISMATANAINNAIESPRFERRMNDIIQNQLVNMLSGIMQGLEEVLDPAVTAKVHNVMKTNVVNLFRSQEPFYNAELAKQQMEEQQPARAVEEEEEVRMDGADFDGDRLPEKYKRKNIGWKRMCLEDKEEKLFELIGECYNEQGKLPTGTQFHKYHPSAYGQAMQMYEKQWQNVVDAYIKSL